MHFVAVFKSLSGDFELPQSVMSYNLDSRTKLNCFKKLEEQIEPKKIKGSN